MVEPTSPNASLPRVWGYPHLPPTWERAVLLVDKPKGWSSFDVIRRLRRLIKVRKIGHAGTLDPMATGLLICLVGRATKAMEAFMGMPKRYKGVIRLGETTPSYDAETEVDATFPTDQLTLEDIQNAATAFVGTIQQRPPMYSAIKVKGERLYKKARRGETVERPMRTVTITAFDLDATTTKDVHFAVACSKGTYIRSLAHDFGAQLGVGGHLTALRRTHIGVFDVQEAWTIAQLEATLNAQSTEPNTP